MKRLFQLVVCFSLISSVVFAGRGGIGERLFFQIGGTVGADVMNMTGTIAKGEIDERLETPYTSTNVNFATLVLAGRINFLELSNNSSLGLVLRPCASFGRAFNDYGGTSTMVRLPFSIELNTGAAATVSTRAKTGVTFGLGYELVKYPVGNGITVASDNGQERAIKAGWGQYVGVVGIKFFGKHYFCREINFKASYSSRGGDNYVRNLAEEENSYYKNIGDWQTVGLMISFLQYLNY
ncbi:MAG: hypothetical protein MJ198_03420 [Bacteroidales bacterium]|nr:hypothetical protein [Bacteroidales bacterium]